MIRTKYIAGIFAIIVLILVVFLLYLSKGNVESAFSAAPGGRALVIDALQEDSVFTVSVADDTTREETRASLIAELKDFIPPAEPEVVYEPEPEPEEEEESEIVSTEEVTEPIVPQDEPKKVGPFYCTDEGYTPGILTWDGMKSVVSEGKRLVRSLEELEDASPMHSFEVSASPSITGREGCLPRGMIGVGMDGRVIQAGAPFVTVPDGQVGYALDGFGIFGMYESGAFVKEESLDVCHGHIHPIMWDESFVSMYHYHVTESSPYTLGCFRGSPVVAK